MPQPSTTLPGSKRRTGQGYHDPYHAASSFLVAQAGDPIPKPRILDCEEQGCCLMEFGEEMELYSSTLDYCLEALDECLEE